MGTEQRHTQALLQTQLGVMGLAQRTASTAQLTRRLAGILERLPGVDAGGVYLRDEEPSAWRLAAQWNFSDAFRSAVSIMPSRSKVGRLIASGQVQHYSLTGTGTRAEYFRLIRREGFRAVAFYPLLCAGRPLGALKLATREGEPFPADVRRTIEGVSGLIGMILGRCETDRYMAEQGNQQDALFHRIPEALIIADPRGRILQTNRWLQKLLNYSHAFLRGKMIWMLHPRDCRPEVRQHFDSIIKGRKQGCQTFMRRRDGKRIPVEIRCVRGERDGCPVVYGLVHDLSCQVGMQEKVREYSDNFRIMAESSRDGLIVMQTGKAPVYANQRAMELSGLPRDKILSTPVDRWLQGRPGIAETMRRIRSGAVPWERREMDLQPVLGSKLRVQVVIEPTRWLRQPALLCEIRDVTWERKLQKQLMRAGAWERQNLARLLHDGISAQLTASIYLCHSVAGRLGTEKHTAEDRVLEIEGILQGLQDQVRNLARGLLPSMNHGTLCTRLHHLAEISRSVYGAFCRVDCDQAFGVMDCHCAEEVYYIAQESFVNAMRHGKPKVLSVYCGAAPRPGWGRLVVRDDGRGFDPARVRARDQSLGIDIMTYRAAMLGGHLKVQSRPSKGTRISCDFPLPCKQEQGVCPHRKSVRREARKP